VKADLNHLLKATSRSFYLTLRVLPSAVRPQIGLAYLLARTADTIADTEIIPLADRLEALKNLRERILGQRSTPLNFTGLSREQGIPAERVLLEKAEASVALLNSLTPSDLKLVRDVLTTITSGQELDLLRFEKATPEKIVALETPSELDDYTYRVAGCVGEFWTRICRAHLFPNARVDEKQLIADGIRLGKGLQLVNILRDLPADLKKGRCYLPTQRLERAKLFPEVLFSPTLEEKFLPLYHEYLDKAESHLRAGWTYANTLPFGQFRVRLACAWPILIGLRNLNLLRGANVAQIRARVKVPRGEVYGMMLRSILACPFPFFWRRLPLSPAKAVASGRELA
jgi:farnesyl-diphosphate farnesyltransferase